jgi:hypothetical protein
MGHIPEDENFDEFMNASAEEWSKPEEIEPEPEVVEEHDRWGSPLPEEPAPKVESEWKPEPVIPDSSYTPEPPKKNASKWWIIAIIIVVVLCICLCVAVVAGLPLLGLNLLEGMPLEFNNW